MLTQSSQRVDAISRKINITTFHCVSMKICHKIVTGSQWSAERRSRLIQHLECTTVSDLSAQQRNILKWLINCVRFAEQHNPQLLVTGFPWNPQPNDKSRENCWRASLCRTLSRLERRRLVTRIKGPQGRRTVRVMLTTEGRSVAEALVGN